MRLNINMAETRQKERSLVFLLLFVLICGVLMNAMAEATNGAVKKANTKPKIKAVPRIDRTDFPALYPYEPCLEGDAVWMVQARLRDLGYDIQPDGRYNQPTIQNIRLFQLAHGLPDNGIVTKPVWEALMLQDESVDCLTENDAEKAAKRMMIIIDVATRKLTLYEDDKVVKEYPVAVGKSETPTPLGEWKVAQKCINWGNGFGTRWMGLNVPWGIFGIHGTDKPYSIGSYASHGCIRMFNRQVEELYPLVPWGCTVRIVENGRMFPEDLTPVKLKKGSSGQRVVYVQSRLKELGIVMDRADGRYGNMTELAVKYYQIWHDLPATGEMDEATYEAMGMVKGKADTDKE
ncbi:MAG: L,D-transpeptidase family protein [Deltaproteobacteria bacterium]